ncbi:hypothetical protein AHAS_Ahas09G0178200 [Arachis hypogaea]
MPRVKLAEIVNSEPEDSNNSLGTNSTVDYMDNIPKKYAIGFSESISKPWVKPSDNRATFVDPPLIKKPFLDPPSSDSLLVLFEEGGDFVRRLKFSSVTKAIRTSADVVLLQMPVFEGVDLTLLRPDSDLFKLARHFQMSLSDAGRYAKELSKSRHVKKSSSKNKHPKRWLARSKIPRGSILTLIGLVISLVISSMVSLSLLLLFLHILGMLLLSLIG